jgi:hypothetical protein
METITSGIRSLTLKRFLRSTRTRALRTLCGVLLAASIPVAHASLTPGWTPFLSIKSIVVEDGEALLVINGGVPTAYLRDDCNTSPYNVIDVSTVQGRSKLAIAMNAYNMGQPVQLALQACSSGGWPMITHILMGSGL